MCDHRDITFVIASDYPTTRQMLRSILEGHGFRVLGEAPNGAEAIRACRELKPDIAILDVSLPLLNGLDASRLIKLNHPQVKMIILTVYAAGAHLLESLAVGASAYITKGKAANCLLDAVTAVCEGDTYVRVSSEDCFLPFVPPMPDDLRSLTVRPLKAAAPRDGVILTRRQGEVLAGILRMLANKEIACELNMTERTVKFHVGSLLAKFKVRCRMDLVRRASLQRLKFLPPALSGSAKGLAAVDCSWK